MGQILVQALFRKGGVHTVAFPVMTVRKIPFDAVDDLGGEGMDRHMGAVRTRDHRAWNFVVVFIEGLVAHSA